MKLFQSDVQAFVPLSLTLTYFLPEILTHSL